MSQDFDAQHFGRPSEPGAPGHQQWLKEQASRETECEHRNVTWLSGVPFVVIALNGDVAAVCDDCGLEATLDQMEEAADALPF